jgi:hypothetical protein
VNAVNLRKPLILTVVATALVGSLAMNGLSATAASVPGVSSTEIVLGMQLPQTGGASPGYNKIDDAARAYFDYVNSKGGVNGRSIKLVAKDDTYKAGVTITTARELINNELIIILIKRTGKDSSEHISLNPRKVSEIKSFLENNFFDFFNSPMCFRNVMFIKI